MRREGAVRSSHANTNAAAESVVNPERSASRFPRAERIRNSFDAASAIAAAHPATGPWSRRAIAKTDATARAAPRNDGSCAATDQSRPNDPPAAVIQK
ncbi:MAG: hypothetical protein HMLKMBBP_03907 [Planctomycetes bacterium]|nr:hypothetical protein [Planctomycetota bacterium]